MAKRQTGFCSSVTQEGEPQYQVYVEEGHCGWLQKIKNRWVYICRMPYPMNAQNMADIAAELTELESEHE